MIEISSIAQALLDGLDNRYASHVYRKYYGKSTYRNWQTIISDIISSLEISPNVFGRGINHSTEWGDIVYSRFRVQQNIIVVIERFLFNYSILHNWFMHAIYPPTPKSTTIVSTINSINYVRPFRSFRLANGNLVYAVQSDTHLYSLADKGKNLVIDKWFDSLSFPIQQQIENLQIIGYGSCKGIPYYIDSNLKMHHGAEIAQMQRRKIEGIERYKIRLTEEEFYQLITECVLQTLKEIC